MSPFRSAVLFCWSSFLRYGTWGLNLEALPVWKCLVLTFGNSFSEQSVRSRLAKILCQSLKDIGLLTSVIHMGQYDALLISYLLMWPSHPSPPSFLFLVLSRILGNFAGLPLSVPSLRLFFMCCFYLLWLFQPGTSFLSLIMCAPTPTPSPPHSFPFPSFSTTG